MYLFNIKCGCFIRDLTGAFCGHELVRESSSKNQSPYSSTSCIEKVVRYVNMLTGAVY